MALCGLGVLVWGCVVGWGGWCFVCGVCVVWGCFGAGMAFRWVFLVWLVLGAWGGCFVTGFVTVVPAHGFSDEGDAAFGGLGVVGVVADGGAAVAGVVAEGACGDGLGVEVWGCCGWGWGGVGELLGGLGAGLGLAGFEGFEVEFGHGVGGLVVGFGVWGGGLVLPPLRALRKVTFCCSR